MMAPTQAAIAAAIEAAYAGEAGFVGSPEGHLEEGLSYWAHAFPDKLSDRRACDSDSCPGRLAKGRCLVEGSDAMRSVMKAEVLALIRQLMAEFAVTFQPERPEAVLREIVETT